MIRVGHRVLLRQIVMYAATSDRIWLCMLGNYQKTQAKTSGILNKAVKNY